MNVSYIFVFINDEVAQSCRSIKHVWPGQTFSIAKVLINW